VANFGSITHVVSVDVSDRIVGGTLSKGNQIKWYKNGVWYKADYLGYEGLAEHICSALLKASNVKSFVEYEIIVINETEGKDSYLGCKSNNFPLTGVFHSVESLLHRLPDKYNVFLEPRQTLKASVYDFCAGIEKYFYVDIIGDIIEMLAFDFIVGNEDRHLINFGLVENEDRFVFAPLFDHGLSLLSDMKSDAQYTCIDEIVYKPFDHLRKGGHGLDSILCRPLSIDTVKFICEEKKIRNAGIYPINIIDRAMGVLYKSLDETEGSLWTKG